METIFQTPKPTLRHVPKRARASWAQALIRALAITVHENSIAAWAELDMLAKCTLCPPPRSGHAHDKAAAAFTMDRLDRWMAGERMSLWDSCPTPRMRRSDESAESKRRRAIALAREGYDGKACASLLSEPLLPANSSTYRRLKSLHPEAPTPQCPSTGELALAPKVD